jgi:hypothetical protein
LQDFGFLEFDFNVKSISDKPLAIGGSFNITWLPLLMPITREYQLRGRLSTIDLLIRVGCFATKVNNIFNLKKN